MQKKEPCFRESDELGGMDPYSNSKSCSELITDSYRNSFLNPKGIFISTCRAGNAIGGGDFSPTRIIPRCFFSLIKNQAFKVRSAFSVHPYQHVLDAICCYLLIAARQYEEQKIQGAFNIGPDENDYVTTGELVNMFCNAWGGNATWEETITEPSFMELDSIMLNNAY